MARRNDVVPFIQANTKPSNKYSDDTWLNTEHNVEKKIAGNINLYKSVVVSCCASIYICFCPFKNVANISNDDDILWIVSCS